MLGYIAARDCRMEYLRRELDDPAAAPCGRCDNCTGQPWPDAVGEADTAAAGDRLLRPGVEVPPRRMWPSGMKDLGIDVSGKIAPELSAQPGRALGRLTDLGWGPRLRTLVAATPRAPGPPTPTPGGRADSPVPADIVDAVVKVLAAWDWAARPVAIVSLPSRTRPALIDGLSCRIADIGRLNYLGSLAYADDSGLAASGLGAGQPAIRQHNSAQRLRALWTELTLPDALRDAVARIDGPILLVDDRIDTGWTMTVAAKVLREAGAPAVLPFALAVTSGG
jgi:ATP-dependent DNA helicase RecQ